MSAPGATEFVLVEKDGYSKNEVFEADSLEEMAEYLKQKTGERPVEA